MDSGAEDDRKQIEAYVERLTSKYDRRYWVDCARNHKPTDELWHELAKGGFFSLMAPEEYGGSGRSVTKLAILTEQLAQRGIILLDMVVTLMAGLTIAKHGSEEQKQRYLPGIVDGTGRFCFAMTEPNSGSNAFRIRCLARRDGDEYVLNGQKVYITGVDCAQHMLLVARTTPADAVADKRQGLSLFIVDPKVSGLTMHRQDTEILEPGDQFELFFDDVRIPRANLVGEEGRAVRALFEALNPERIAIAATSVGIARFALSKAVAYACTRKVFDDPIGAYQGLAHPMAIAKIETELAALMMHHSAQVYDAGGDAGAESNMAKYAAAEAAIKAVDIAIQVHGGSAFMAETDVVALWPLVRVQRVAPVSREMVLNHIAEHVLGLPRSY